MANDYYQDSGNPGTNAQGSSSVMRAEFAALELAFDKLPPLTGNGSKALVMNAGGTAMTVTAAALALAVALTTAGSGGITLTSTAATNVTLPTTGTLATLAGAETLTNKTLNLTSNTLVATSAQLAAAVTDETGSGALVFANTPTLVTPNIGAATGTTLTATTSVVTPTVTTVSTDLTLTSGAGNGNVIISPTGLGRILAIKGIRLSAGEKITSVSSNLVLQGADIDALTITGANAVFAGTVTASGVINANGVGLDSNQAAFTLLGSPTTVTFAGGASVALNIGNAAAAAAFAGGISIPTGKNVTGAGTAQVTGFATVSATTLTGTLSTASQTNVTGLGTITTGVWNATDIAVADGGTGSSTAAGARTNLGLVIGTDVQAFDAELAAIAGLVSAADQLPYFTGSGTAALATFTATARSLLDDASVTAMRATLAIAGKAAIPVPASAITPRSANGSAALATTNGAADQPDVPYLAFDGAAKEYAGFLMRMPKSWNESTVTAAFSWRRASGVAAANVVLGIRAVAVSDNDSPAAAFGTDATVTDAASTTTANMNLSGETGACTIGGTPAEGDLVFFEVFRDGAAAGDTLDAVDVWLTEVTLFITLNETNDA